MFMRSSLTMYIFISLGVASCSLKSRHSWWANGIDVYRIQSITGKSIWYWSLPPPSLQLVKLTHKEQEHCFTPRMIRSLVEEGLPALHGGVQAGLTNRHWPSFPASGTKICPGWGSVSSVSTEQHRDVLTPRFPPGWTGQKRERETQTVEDISTAGPTGKSWCREVHDCPCSVTPLCVMLFACKKLKVWK